jgi:hypothetical protein
MMFKVQLYCNIKAWNQPLYWYHLQFRLMQKKVNDILASIGLDGRSIVFPCIMGRMLVDLYLLHTIHKAWMNAGK